MEMNTGLQRDEGVPPDEPWTPGRPAGLPLTRSLSTAYPTSLLISGLVSLASAAAFWWDTGELYAGSTSVLVSSGADAANLVVVVPVLLGSTWLARRGSLIGLLLWPGALSYVLYAYTPYLVGARFTPLLFMYVAIVTTSAFTLVGVVTGIDGTKVRALLAAAAARPMGGALMVTALLAYAGLVTEAVGALGSPISDPAWRGHWVADWAVGTPVLLLGGWLLWHRTPLGYVAAAGLLLVSGLGGIAFSAAAAIDNLLAAPCTEPTVIVVHLIIAAVSLGLLWTFFATGSFRQTRDAGRAA